MSHVCAHELGSIIVYEELESSEQLERNITRNEILQKKTQIESEEAKIRAQMAKSESANKIRQLLSSANKIYIDTKRTDIEIKIESLQSCLLKGEINTATFEKEMQEMFQEIQAAYKEAIEREPQMLPDPNDATRGNRRSSY